MSAPWLGGLLVPVDVPVEWNCGRPRAYTVGRFVQDHPRGRFILDVRGHVVSVVDGVVIDYTPGPKRRILAAWEFQTE